MRRPGDVKAHFHFLSFFLSVSLFPFSQAAPVAILPFALFVSDLRSVPGGCSRFSRCCYLRIDLSSHRFGESRAPGLSRSHLASAVELGSSDRHSLGHFPHRFLAIAQWFVHLSPLPTPDAAGPPAFEPRPPPLASWHFSLLAPQACAPISADHCLLQKVPECSALPAPSSCADTGLLLC